MRSVEGTLAWILACGGTLSALMIPAKASMAQPALSGITFAQLDWYDPAGSLAQADSLYGQMSWSYVPDATTTYYLNVNVSLTSMGTASWTIRNLPLFAVDNGDFSTRHEGTYFDLAELGLSAGTDLSQIYYSTSVASTIQVAAPGPASTLASVQTLERRASDDLAESPDAGPFTNPGQPEGVKLDAAPVKVNPGRDVRGVQEGGSKCAAGSFARSIDWLNRQHGLGINKTAQQIYDDLIAAGVSAPGQGGPNSRDEWIEYKNIYARAQTGKRIVTKVWERTAGTVDDTAGVAQQTGDFATWLQGEIDTEDVELAYFYPGNAHIVTVLEVYKKNGDTYVKYRDDEEQDDATKGDGQGGAKYPAVKHAKVYLKNGQYHFGSDTNTIYFAVSESAVGGVPALGWRPQLILVMLLSATAGPFIVRRMQEGQAGRRRSAAA